MATINIPKNYADGTVLFESDLDDFRDTIETFLNVTKINDDNIQTSGITASTKLVDGSINAAKIGASAVTTAKINVDAVDKDKINADVAGDALVQNVSGALDVDYDDQLFETPAYAVQTFVDGSVNTSTEAIIITSHGYETGTPIQLSTTGTLPGGLSAATTYYIVDTDANTIGLSTTYANANANSLIDITSAAGGGTHTVTPDNADAFKVKEAGILPYMLAAGAAASTINETKFTSSTTWVVPAGVSSCVAMGFGAGGGGGGGGDASISAAAAGGGGGGGAGGRFMEVIALTPGETVTITIGAGGTAGAAGNGAPATGGTGGTGGNSSFAAVSETFTFNGAAPGLGGEGLNSTSLLAAGGRGRANGGMGGFAIGGGSGAMTGNAGAGAPYAGTGGSGGGARSQSNLGSAGGGGGGGNGRTAGATGGAGLHNSASNAAAGASASSNSAGGGGGGGGHQSSGTAGLGGAGGVGGSGHVKVWYLTS